MKFTKLLLVMIAAVLVAFGLSGNVLAFHDGGVAHCDGCHSMHSAAGTKFLVGADSSSTCLNCHKYNPATDGPNVSYYKVMTDDGSALWPGGDFGWTQKTFTWTITRGTTVIPQQKDGYNLGHSVIASDFGMVVDPDNPDAPGGGAIAYPSTQLFCDACHDPHGSPTRVIGTTFSPIGVSGSYGDPVPAGTVAGPYRLLASDNYQTPAGTFFTVANSPQAISIKSPETNSNHADYGAYMTEWCANCHGDFLSGNKHPVGAAADLAGQEGTNYNAYKKTGDLTGLVATAYEQFVPFARGAGQPLSTSTTAGTDTNSFVSCLTCHRAHASAFDYGVRWDITTEFPVSDSHPQTGDGGVVGNEVSNKYYGRNMTADFGDFQRSLCNKCHIND
jgi:predicted CXXCH cytochrome family protein